MGKKCVVRDPADHADAISQGLQAAGGLGWQYRGLTWSPIVGPAGNIEYLLWLAMESLLPMQDLKEITQITETAVRELKPKPA